MSLSPTKSHDHAAEIRTSTEANGQGIVDGNSSTKYNANAHHLQLNLQLFTVLCGLWVMYGFASHLVLVLVSSQVYVYIEGICQVYVACAL